MSDTDDATADSVEFPWITGAATAQRPVLHLVVAWFLDERRVGQSARIDRPCMLGRVGERLPGDPPLVQFNTQRIETTDATPAIATRMMSRRQILFEPTRERDAVRVRRIGKRRLTHCGTPVTECVARAGDTLALDKTAVFLLEMRPPELPSGHYYPSPKFPFGRPDPHGYVGESAAAWKLREQLAEAARSSSPVLLLGPSGSGKELAAAMLHGLSFSKTGPFVARNATTLTATLSEAELFGNLRDYPNAGSPERPGLVGAANGGYLFLDEVGDLPETQQTQLLRVMDHHGEYQRLGEATTRRSNFSLIGATNRDPEKLRSEFLARFKTLIEVPDLGARRSDIPFLARELLERIRQSRPELGPRFSEGTEPRLDPYLVEALLLHPFSSNARELERLLLISTSASKGNFFALRPDVIAKLRLPSAEPASGKTGRPGPDVSWLAVHAALRDAEGNQTRAAEELGLNRHALGRLLEKVPPDDGG